jgi:hypothetical protein
MEYIVYAVISIVINTFFLLTSIRLIGRKLKNHDIKMQASEKRILNRGEMIENDTVIIRRFINKQNFEEDLPVAVSHKNLPMDNSRTVRENIVATSIVELPEKIEESKRSDPPSKE